MAGISLEFYREVKELSKFLDYYETNKKVRVSESTFRRIRKSKNYDDYKRIISVINKNKN